MASFTIDRGPEPELQPCIADQPRRHLKDADSKLASWSHLPYELLSMIFVYCPDIETARRIGAVNKLCREIWRRDSDEITYTILRSTLPAAKLAFRLADKQKERVYLICKPSTPQSRPPRVPNKFILNEVLLRNSKIAMALYKLRYEGIEFVPSYPTFLGTMEGMHETFYTLCLLVECHGTTNRGHDLFGPLSKLMNYQKQDLEHVTSTIRDLHTSWNDSQLNILVRDIALMYSPRRPLRMLRYLGQWRIRTHNIVSQFGLEGRLDREENLWELTHTR